MLKLKAKKIEMTQIFNPDGKVVPVTLLSLIGTDDRVWSDLSLGSPVVIRSVSKGKGFQGVVKLHHFKGGPATHGQSDRHRGPGSIGGTTTPGRVYKGKRMAGRMGNNNVTVKGLKLILIDQENKKLGVSGPVPGGRNGEVSLSIK
ncbi:MAG: 50S ribosomal protein L3 [Patescibacteria group bacterium]